MDLLLSLKSSGAPSDPNSASSNSRTVRGHSHARRSTRPMFTMVRWPRRYEIRPSDCSCFATPFTLVRCTPIIWAMNSCVSGAGEVVHSHEPLTHTLFDSVKRVASGVLLNLAKEELLVLDEQSEEIRRRLRHRFEVVSAYNARGAGYLDDHLMQ